MISLSGKVLQDTYRIDRCIGRGGMGSVFEATHLRLGRRFAVKVLELSQASDRGRFERFRREALVTSRIGHSHIVEVIDFNTTEDLAYLVMELLVGETLAHRLQRGQLALDRATRIFGEAASALHAAHEQNIVHRDLKPQNIFLCQRDGRDDYVKVVDFGISKILGVISSLTRTDTLVGSPRYMAPEQAEGRGSEADRRTDVYAMAAILYEMICGRPVFAEDALPAVLAKILHAEPEPLQQHAPQIGDAVAAAVHRGLSKTPDGRHPSMRAFWEALVTAMGADGARVASAFVQPLPVRVNTGQLVVQPEVVGPTDPPGSMAVAGQETETKSPAGPSSTHTPTVRDRPAASLTGQPSPSQRRSSVALIALVAGLFGAVSGGVVLLVGQCMQSDKAATASIASGQTDARTSRPSSPDAAVARRSTDAAVAGSVADAAVRHGADAGPPTAAFARRTPRRLKPAERPALTETRDPSNETSGAKQTVVSLPRFSGCRPVFGRSTVTGNDRTISIANPERPTGGTLSFTAPKGTTGSISCTYDEVVRRGVLILLMSGQTYINMPNSPADVETKKMPDPIKGELDIRRFEPFGGVVDISFREVTLVNRANQVCTINGRLHTTGLRLAAPLAR